MHLFPFSFSVFFLIAVSSTSSGQPLPTRSEIRVLVPLPADWQGTQLFGMSSRGDIIGEAFSTASAATVGWIWTRSTGFQEIAPNTLPLDINARGDVVGAWRPCNYPCEEPTFGFFWNVTEGFQDLGNFVPVAVNNRGDMAGSCFDDPCPVEEGLIVTSVETHRIAEGSAINERGDVVGSTGGSQGGFLRTRDGSVVHFGAAMREPVDINNAGTIAGTRLSGNSFVAVIRTRTGQFVTLQPGTRSFAINARGWVTGWLSDGVFLWVPSTGAFVRLPAANAITLTDRGDVAGLIAIEDGPHLAVWHIVP